ncbi:MAG: hypothetical protein IJY23_05395 [Clostridia bacterium]|nr:hypothetical protein [Clostridia bacterium]
MELIQELFISFLKSERFQISLSEKIDFDSIIEKECYKTLNKIKEIIQNEELEDSDCFAKIEKIVRLFESAGIDCGSRHDFG